MRPCAAGTNTGDERDCRAVPRQRPPVRRPRRSNPERFQLPCPRPRCRVEASGDVIARLDEEMFAFFYESSPTSRYMTQRVTRQALGHPDKRTSSVAKLASAARAIVTYQTSLPLGCTRTHRIFFWLRPHEQLDDPVVDELLDAIRGLPVGTERLRGSRDVLR